MAWEIILVVKIIIQIALKLSTVKLIHCAWGYEARVYISISYEKEEKKTNLQKASNLV